MQFTLKTNISRRKKATVLKLPSQMLGFPLPGEKGRSPEGGRAGRDCRSCFLSEVECVRRAGRVGRGRVGSSMAVGIPAEEQSLVSLPWQLKYNLYPRLKMS